MLTILTGRRYTLTFYVVMLLSLLKLLELIPASSGNDDIPHVGWPYSLVFYPYGVKTTRMCDKSRRRYL